MKGRIIAMTFGQVLADLIRRYDSSKTLIARALGVTVTYVSSVIEERNKPFTLKRCEQLSDFLRLSVSDRTKLVELAAIERAPKDTRHYIKTFLQHQPGLGIVKDPGATYRVPVVSRAAASAEKGHFDFEPVEHEFIEFKGCKAVEVVSDSMAPIAYRGQKIVYSEIEEPHDGNLVFVKLKDGRQLFKRLHRNKRKKMVILNSANQVQWEEPIMLDEDEVVWCYKVVGVRF